MTDWPRPTIGEIRTAFNDHGVKWVDQPGAETRHRGMWRDGLRALVDHHTAGVGDGVMTYMLNKGGRYPFCNSSVRRNGEVWVFAYGSAWGSGEGVWPYTPKLWPDNRLHEVAWQTEVESRGLEPDFTDVQMEALGRQNAAFVDLGVPAGNEINHRDYAPRRKIDTRYDIKVLRANTAKYVKGVEDVALALTDDDIERIWQREVTIDGKTYKMGALLVAAWRNSKVTDE